MFDYLIAEVLYGYFQTRRVWNVSAIMCSARCGGRRLRTLHRLLEPIRTLSARARGVARLGSGCTVVATHQMPPWALLWVYKHAYATDMKAVFAETARFEEARGQAGQAGQAGSNTCFHYRAHHGYQCRATIHGWIWVEATRQRSCMHFSDAHSSEVAGGGASPSALRRRAAAIVQLRATGTPYSSSGGGEPENAGAARRGLRLRICRSVLNESNQLSHLDRQNREVGWPRLPDGRGCHPGRDVATKRPRGHARSG